MVASVLCSFGSCILWAVGLGILAAILYYDIILRWLKTRQDLTNKHIVVSKVYHYVSQTCAGVPLKLDPTGHALTYSQCEHQFPNL